MIVVFFYACIIEIIIQIVAIVKLKKTGNSKYWNLFMGIFFANFISTPLAYPGFLKNAISLGEGIICMFVFGFSFISNVILLIVGLIVKKTIKVEVVKLNKKSFFISIMIIIANIIILFVLPVIQSNFTLKSGERHIISYLNNKYGNGNYSVFNVYRKYSDNGIVNRELSGYCYEIKSDYMKDTFIVSIDDNFDHIRDDYFIPVYFSQKYNFKYTLKYDYDDFSEFNNYIKEIIKKRYLIELSEMDIKCIYLNLSYNSNHNTNIVSVNNGKIPTIEELINSLIKYNK